MPNAIKNDTILSPMLGLSEGVLGSALSEIPSPLLPKSGALVPNNALPALTQPNGIISNVKSVATKPPPMRETAIPSKIGSERIKIEPPTNANAVIIIGRVRVSQA